MSNTSIYDYRDNEFDAARQIRRERVLEICTAIVGVPLGLAAIVVVVLACACA